MIRNLSRSFHEELINYAIDNSNFAFIDYISHCHDIISQRRTDLDNQNKQHIITANCPYELIPKNPIFSANKRLKYGVLLIHGLLDGPFSLKDIGVYLQNEGMLCRSILLPGHGTRPEDLHNISYHHWIQAVQYGVNSLKQEADQIILVGYSTGAALSAYQAFNDAQIASIIMLAPAIRVRAPNDIIMLWHKLLNLFKLTWTYKGIENDYVKYRSIASNAINQLVTLTRVISDLYQRQTINCPVFLAVSREDETICSDSAIDFFSHLPNPNSELLLYTSWAHRYPDSRIKTRSSFYPDLNVNHFSHVSIPFNPSNPHYGANGDYFEATKCDPQLIYGAYNRFESGCFDLLYKLGITRKMRKELTYNPDFDFMADRIANFIFTQTNQPAGQKATSFNNKNKRELTQATNAILE